MLPKMTLGEESSTTYLQAMDQLMVVNVGMDKVSRKNRNLSVTFHDYQNVHDMVRHD